MNFDELDSMTASPTVAPPTPPSCRDSRAAVHRGQQLDRLHQRLGSGRLARVYLLVEAGGEYLRESRRGACEVGAERVPGGRCLKRS
jgi:hypothetical protein